MPMNQIHLYTIWQRVPDLVENPLLPDDFIGTPGDTTFTLTETRKERGSNGEGDVEVEIEVEHPIFIVDPRNSSGLRYVAIKCVHDIVVAREVCEGSSGEYVYTISSAFFGNDYD